MDNLFIALAFISLSAVLWKALDTVQRLSTLAAAATPLERAQAFTAAVARPEKRKDEADTEPRPVLEGLGPRA